jgi:hypothetical protein
MPNSTVPAADEGLPNRRRLLIAAGSSAALGAFGAATVDAAPAISVELERLIEAHQAAYDAYGDALIAEDEASNRCELLLKERGYTCE